MILVIIFYGKHLYQLATASMNIYTMQVPRLLTQNRKISDGETPTIQMHDGKRLLKVGSIYSLPGDQFRIRPFFF